jgi:hypothetical protein
LVSEPVRRVGGNIDDLPRPDRLFVAAKRDFDLASQNRERLLEIMPMRRRTTAWRNVHVDQAITPRRIFPRYQNRVRIACHANVRKARVVRIRKRESARLVVCRNVAHLSVVIYR